MSGMLSNENKLKAVNILQSLNLRETSGLEYSSPYTLLVAAILSAQSKDERVNMITPELFAIASTPEDMVKLDFDTLCSMIKTIGLYKNKAKNILALSAKLVEKRIKDVERKNQNDYIPSTLDELIQLPGVGRKTANVILNVIYKKPVMPVDTHVFRVAKRIGLSDKDTTLGVEKDLMNLPISDDMKTKLHHWLVWHGRRTCKAKKPKCNECPLRSICSFANVSL